MKMLSYLENIGYYLYYIFSIILPQYTTYKFAKFIGLCVSKLLQNETHKRSIIIRQLTGKSYQEAKNIVITTYINFNLGLIDFFKSGKINNNNFYTYYDKIDNIELLDKAVNSKRPVVLLSFHIGNWEMIGKALGFHKYPIYGLISPPKTKFIGWFFQRIREKNCIQVIPNNKPKKIIDTLKNNKILGILMDVNKTKKNLSYNYKNLQVNIPKAPFILAKKYNALILLIVSYKTKKNKYKIEMKQFKEHDTIEQNSIYALKTLLKIAEQHVTQWHWINNFFELKQNPNINIHNTN